MKKILIAVSLIIGLVSCAEDGDLNQSAEYDLAYIELFDSSTNDWTGGFSDYPDSLENELNFQVDFLNLNSVFTGDNNVLRISGKNPHKDLFYYITRKFSGLEAYSTYRISFTYEFLIEANEEEKNEFSTELYLKAGGTINKPETIENLDFYGPGLNNLSLNYDKGEGAFNGTSSIYYVEKISEKLSSMNPILIQGETEGNDVFIHTDAKGEFWGIFGVDSKTDKELAFSFNTILVFVKKI